MIAIYDKTTGVVRRWVTCPDSEIIYNILYNEDYISVDGMLNGAHKVVDGKLQPYTPEPIEIPYSAKRAMEYPDIREQLDALWHAMNDGLLPKIPDFYDPIKEVKDSYPKPA